MTGDQVPVWVAISHGAEGAFALGVFARRAGAVAACRDEASSCGWDDLGWLDALAAGDGDGEATSPGGELMLSVRRVPLAK